MMKYTTRQEKGRATGHKAIQTGPTHSAGETPEVTAGASRGSIYGNFQDGQRWCVKRTVGAEATSAGRGREEDAFFLCELNTNQKIRKNRIFT